VGRASVPAFRPFRPAQRPALVTEEDRIKVNIVAHSMGGLVARYYLQALGGDKNVILAPPKIMTLEGAIHFIKGGETIEVTTKSLRLRKAVLSAKQRHVNAAAERKAVA
jgi:predicted membrane GTPase involved in stress response